METGPVVLLGPGFLLFAPLACRRRLELEWCVDDEGASHVGTMHPLRYPRVLVRRCVLSWWRCLWVFLSARVLVCLVAARLV